MIKTIICSLAIAAVFTSLAESSSLADSLVGARATESLEQQVPPTARHIVSALSLQSNSAKRRAKFEAAPGPKPLPRENSLTQLTQDSTTAELVIYESANCDVSRRFHHEIANDYMTRKGGRVFPLRRADTANGPVGVRLTRPITMTPTFVFVEHGEEIGRFVGYPGREHFFEILDAAADEFEKMKAAERVPR